MKKFILLLAALWVLVPSMALAWGLNLGSYNLQSDNKLLFIHRDGEASLLNEINYESYTYFGIKAVNLYFHIDSNLAVTKPDDADFLRNPRTIFSTSNVGDWSAWLGVGTRVGPATVEIFQNYTDTTTDNAPTNIAVGFSF